MSEDFIDILKYAAKLNFEQEISEITSDMEPSCIEVDLDCMQIQKLSEKVLLLPPQGIFVLFSKYCFYFTPAETEVFYHLEKAKALLLYYEKLLSFSIGIKGQRIISETSFRDACKIALKKYLDQELCADKRQPVLLASKTRTVFRKMAQKVAIAAIIAMMSFSTMMVANAQFRERVISWVIETFEKYSIFELKSDDTPTIQELHKYKPYYVPEGFQLLHTVEQPSLILYEYTGANNHTLSILMSLSDTQIYIDTEGVALEKLELGDTPAYYFEKDNVHHIIFERDGYYFTVYGTTSKSELIKVAEGIQAQ